VVLLPTYQEADNIVSMLDALRAAVPGAAVVVIDDDSPDGTGKLADEAAGDDPRISVLHRDGKHGLGAAYRDGFAEVLRRGDDVVVTMDCDLSHDPAVVPAMLAEIERGADLVIGSRYVPGGGTVDWPLRRRALSRWGNRYTARALRLPVRDCTSGFRAYRAELLARIEPATTSADGYAFLTELVRRSVEARGRVVEVPITFRDRQRGVSKMSMAVIVESMFRVTVWGLADRVPGGWRSVADRRPARR